MASDKPVSHSVQSAPATDREMFAHLLLHGLLHSAQQLWSVQVDAQRKATKAQLLIPRARENVEEDRAITGLAMS